MVTKKEAQERLAKADSAFDRFLEWWRVSPWSPVIAAIQAMFWVGLGLWLGRGTGC